MHGHHEHLAEQLGVDGSVTFTGWLPPAEVAAVVRTAAWHVLTSHHDAGPENIQRVAAKLAAAGWPLAGIELGSPEES